MNARRLGLVGVVALFAAVAGLASAQAALLVDRGLPTENLNNAAGSSRSNVAWADGDPSLMPGDDFTLPTAAASYEIDTVTVWMIGKTPAFSGTFNVADLKLAEVAAKGTNASFVTYGSPTATTVTYSDGSSYQATDGTYRYIYELDFPVHIVAAGGTLFDFAISATSDTYLPFLHASNKDLSGSPQDGADDTEYFWNPDGTLNYVYQSLDNGWDKNSDFNVQVSGEAVPEPATIIVWSLLGAASWLGMKVWRGGQRISRRAWSPENRQAILDVVRGGSSN